MFPVTSYRLPVPGNFKLLNLLNFLNTLIMSPFLGEFIGTALLIIMGGGVVANVVLSKTKGQNSGWIVITFGWAMAVFIGFYASNS